MLARASCERLPLSDNSVDLIFTDPPYLREYLPCYGWLAQEAARVLKPGGFVMTMAGGMYLPAIYKMFEESGLTYYYEMIHKSTGNGPTVWRGHDLGVPSPIVAKCKPIIVYSKGLAVPRVGGVLNIFEPGSGPNKIYHHWGQDTESARYFIDFFSGPGDLVLDPFIGGGTTAVACELIGRRCLGLDIDPAALATAAARLANTDIMHTLPMFAQQATA